MIHVSIPLIPATDGVLLIPADHVTTLLRRLAADWVESAESGELRGDRQTAGDLSGVLTELADQIDVECIGFASALDDDNA
ncbi:MULTISPECIES: DUF6213 family protein [Streptomyces]|uniref:DUF6213 family protein n=1 Tax=Streptomyces TaxID=1883 RepID=UPI0005EC86B5|nr:MULTISPECIES: DUF6213 family protein [Streptomyces]APU43593.1 hypothetical protein BSL84_31495 [Streptomyces sp. TN58]KJY18572.1 hypothetical protein VR43_24290 [Streptomyces sp. NRRL S-104]KOU30966.1 hypothetical protein ADK53_26985 [Streptomyces sp. WM6373]KOU61914.1 hypothetical protein ADK96_27545 [Streptomyces sp. IGB124]KOU72081.1 hypothetical protein ADK61_27990 [Streptomyces sp. XY66]